MRQGIRSAVVAGWSFVAALAGVHATEAQQRIYQLELAPQAAGLERTLTAWDDFGFDIPNGQLSEDELATLGKLYSQRLTAPVELRQKFRGVFHGALPRDLGGAGSFTTIVTPLGTVSRYSERFRGSDDLDAESADRRDAVNRVADLVVGWLDQELEKSPHREAVHRFADVQIRQDLRKLALAAWLTHLELDDPNLEIRREREEVQSQELIERGIQYCVERRYLKPEEAQQLSSWFDDAGDFEDAAPLLRRMLARGSRIDESQADAAFAFLSNSQALTESLNRYVRTLPEYAQFLKRNGIAPDAPESELPDPGEVVSDWFDKAFTLSDAEPEFVVSLKLSMPVEPLSTNGQYDRAEKSVRWEKSVRRIGLPAYCFAQWAESDDAYQKRHFGETVYDNETLVRFAALYAALDEPYRKQFAAHLDTLNADADPAAKLLEFQLPDDAGDDAHRIVEQLLEVLTESF